LVIALAATPLLAQNEGFGVWQMNPARSSFQPGPAPQSMSATYEPLDTGVRATIVGVDDKGKPFSVGYTAFYDGKEWPLSGSPIASTATFRRIDENTVERIDRRYGRPVQIVVRTVSPDGREAMVIEKGQSWYNVIIFERR
jgi:hypothetical protein